MEGDLRGFTFAGAAAIAAVLGQGGRALSFLKSGLCFCSPNTFYREGGPVIESPLGMAEAVNVMLLHSGGAVMRIFGGIPDAWEYVYFYRLRAEGAFLVSAKREKGRLIFIHIQSLAGEPLAFACGWQGPLTARSSNGSTQKILPDKDGVFHLAPERSEEVLLTSGESSTEALDIPAENIQENLLCHFWGSFKPWRRFGIPYEKARSGF